MEYKSKSVIKLGCFNIAFVLLLIIIIFALESPSKLNLIFILIVILGGFDYVLIFRIRKKINPQLKQNQKIDTNLAYISNEKYYINYEGKIYHFSWVSLVLFPLGTILGSLLLIWFFEQPFNFWWHELTAKHTTYFLNLFFNIGAQAKYDPTAYFPWKVIVPDGVGIYLITGCTGAISTSIFSTFIIFTPPSQDAATRNDIAWRKIKDLFFTFIAIYFFNLIRMVVIFYLYHLGLEWTLIHDSFAKISAVIAVHICIFWFCNKYIPEWYVSIYYSGVLIYRKVKTMLNKCPIETSN